MNIRGAFQMAFPVLFLATIGSLSWSTPAASQTVQARAFVVPPHHEIRMTSGSTQWCVNVEPINGNFQLTDIDPCTVVLISPGTGSVSQISYDCTKPTLIADADGNGLQDIRFCFLKTAMAPLFDNLHGAKPKTVTLTIQGSTFTGQTFTGSVTVQLYLHG